MVASFSSNGDCQDRYLLAYGRSYCLLAAITRLQ